MSKFVKGEIVDFFRNEMLQENNIPVIAVVPLNNILQGNMPQTYIIENLMGFIPNVQRVVKYELDPSAKYLFVNESELS